MADDECLFKDLEDCKNIDETSQGFSKGFLLSLGCVSKTVNEVMTRCIKDEGHDYETVNSIAQNIMCSFNASITFLENQFKEYYKIKKEEEDKLQD